MSFITTEYALNMHRVYEYLPKLSVMVTVVTEEVIRTVPSVTSVISTSKS